MKRMVVAGIILSLTLVPPILHAQVRISEVFYDAVGSDSGSGLEWIELHNYGGSAVDMTGYCLYVSDTAEHYEFGSFTLGAGQYVVVHWAKDGDDTGTDLYTGTTSWGNMSDTASAVALWRDHDHHTVDTILQYIKYGNSNYRSYQSTAAAAGVWDPTQYIPGVPEGCSLEYDGAGNTCADWFAQSHPTPGMDNSLPVTLSSFTAEREDESAVLRWTTQTEIGNVGWRIYRARDPQGPFERLNHEWIAGAGDSPHPNHYRYVDSEPSPGFNYYCLEDLDILGGANRSHVVVLPPARRSQLPLTWAQLRRGMRLAN